MDLLAKAGRVEELAARAETDVHPRRRLDRFRYEQDRDGDLRHRARHGDRYALYMLVRLLRERGDEPAARQAVVDIDATDTYASKLAEQP
ncbi:hypothetical protein ACFP2T_23170 [Plantactinospora solaniradicis]|uniref:Uncharacterized protein n=2 Tax=Plantactinospora solaniradicis TaxID=1723736 RepID=A0ABW1KCB4_9ACTN